MNDATRALALKALTDAKEKFLFYEQQHRAKGTPDADAKAEVNRDMAAQMHTVITVLKGGDAADAIDFALGHIKTATVAVQFLDDWRADRTDKWPAYTEWLTTQCEGARRSKAVAELADYIAKGMSTGIEAMERAGETLIT